MPRQITGRLERAHPMTVMAFKLLRAIFESRLLIFMTEEKTKLMVVVIWE